MDHVLELLKGNNTALGLVAIGWIARELVALRRSVRDQGKRIGALASKVAGCEAKLNIKQLSDDGAS